MKKKHNLIIELCLLLFPVSIFATDLGIELNIYSSLTKEHKARIQSILDQSLFNEKPKSLVEEHITIYDPTLITVVATLYSRLPERDNEYFIEEKLPSVDYPKDSPCPYEMRAFVKRSQKKEPHTFVILPGAYATWKRGSFNNQTIALLNKKFNDPNIISFDGYLSPAFLEDTCDEIPWDAEAIAIDIRERLKPVLKSLKADPEKTGLIGYSGGAGLILPILAEDAKEAGNYKSSRLFGGGGISFSPTLHGLSIFHNLEESVKAISHERALTSLDPSQLFFMATAFLKDFSLDWRDIVDLYEESPKNYRERFFNEFTYRDLRNTLLAVGFDPENVNGEFSYYNVYVNTGFRNSLTPPQIAENLSEDELSALYDSIVSAQPILERIDRPLLIYFSQDDPVLSSYNNFGQPEVITNILNSASQNPNIMVFNPEFGAHIGCFLDPTFEDLVHTFFTHDRE